MNGVNASTHTEQVMTWWRMTYMVCTGAFAVLAALNVVLYAISKRKKSKAGKEC